MKAKNDKGFTLIEMMIVISLMGILMAIAIPGILSQRPLWRVNSDARSVLTNMRLTQSKAIRAGDPFSIAFDASGRSYTIFEDNGAGTGTSGDGIQNGTEATFKIVNLSTMIDFGVIGTPAALLGGSIAADGINLPSRVGLKSIIFKPDGSAETGTVYLYANTATLQAGWQRAVEVVGNTGRVKAYGWDVASVNWM